MLKEYQARELLRVCESAAGKRLESARGNLSSDQKVPTIWELLVFDSLIHIGHVVHEPDSSGTSDIDFSVLLDSGTEVWADAAWIRGRLLDDKRKTSEVIDRVYHHVGSRSNVPVRCIRYKLTSAQTQTNDSPELTPRV